MMMMGYGGYYCVTFTMMMLMMMMLMMILMSMVITVMLILILIQVITYIVSHFKELCWVRNNSRLQGFCTNRQDAGNLKPYILGEELQFVDLR